MYYRMRFDFAIGDLRWCERNSFICEIVLDAELRVTSEFGGKMGDEVELV